MYSTNYPNISKLLAIWRKFAAPLVPLLCIAFPLSSQARALITPTLQVKESFVSSSSSTRNESYAVTTLSPGLLYSLSRSRLDVSVNYQLHAFFNHGGEGEDSQNQSLSLISIFTHNPQKWASKLFGSIAQSTSNIDGIQLLTQETQTERTQELRTLGVNSHYNGRIKQAINVKTEVQADYADFENDQATSGLGFSLSLDNQRVDQRVYWNIAASSQHESAGENTEYVNTAQLGLNYVIKPRLTTFIKGESVDTKNSGLSQSSYSIGLDWIPNRQSQILVSVGERGDSTTYSVDSRLNRKKVSLGIHYQESITSARSTVIDQSIDSDVLTSSVQTLLITPVLQKRGGIDLNMKGDKLNTRLSWFNQSRFVDVNSGADEKIEGVAFTVTRNLPGNASMALNMQRQRTEALQVNEVSQVSLSYRNAWTKNLDLSVDVSSSKQDSDIDTNEIEESLVSFTLSARF